MRIFLVSFAFVLFSPFLSLAQKTAMPIERWNNFTISFLDNSSDQVKRAALDTFKTEFSEWLEEPISYNLKYDQLKNISRIEAPDNSFRIFSFHVLFNDGHYENFGYTQYLDPKTKEIHTAELKDNKPDYKVVETKNFGKNQWYGATYYSIVPKPIGKKGQYVIIGLDNNNRLTKRKVMEVISFNRFGDPIFGAPIFKTERRAFNRIVLEYNAKAQITVRYQKENNWIVFDYIAPIDPKYKDMFEYYGPSGEYDAFIIEKNILKINRGADARNNSENKGNMVKTPSRKLGPRD